MEARVPLLDHRITEFAWRLPVALRMRGPGKWPLRELLYRRVPRALVDRPKQGFSVPMAAWLRGPLRGWAEELLSAERLRREGFLQPAPVREVWAQHLAGTHDWQHRLWPVLSFQAWLVDQ